MNSPPTRRSLQLAAAATLALGACLVPTGPWPDDFGIQFEGIVVGSEPVQGATVEVWKLDGDGNRTGGPHRTVETDAEGRFSLKTGRSFMPPFVITARGGVTSEHWSSEPLALEDDEHVRATLTFAWLLRADEPGLPLVLSPLTTTAAALAEARLAEGLDEDIEDAAESAHALLDQHFDLDLRGQIPAPAADGQVSEGARHSLVLAGLSSLAHAAADAGGRSIQAMNIFRVTDALSEDALGPGARLDGVGPDGPVTLGSCGEACPLAPDALAAALVRALAADYLRLAREHRRPRLRRPRRVPRRPQPGQRRRAVRRAARGGARRRAARPRDRRVARLRRDPRPHRLRRRPRPQPRP